MRRLMAFMAACGIALGLLVGMAGTASAAGEVLGCRITPAPASTPFTSPTCGQREAASSYSIGYQVLNETGSYTFAWTVPAGYPILGGCTSTSDGCAIQASGLRDQRITVSVTLTQGTSRETLSASAFISAVCGNVFC